jgi:glycosyltransferase involved in cell wall biosynthesis
VTAELNLSDDVAATRGGADGVLHVCTRYLRGGSERRLRDMIRALPQYDHHVVVGEESDVDLAAEQLDATSISVEPSLCRELRPIRDLRAAWRLRRRMRADGFRLVVTHQSKAGAVGRAAAVFAGRPTVIHSLSMASFGPGYPKPASVLFRGAERVLEPFTSGYAVVGEDLLRRYVGIGIPAHKCRVIRSGVPLPVVSPRAEARARLAARHDVPADRPLVAYVGSLDRRKGADQLVPFLSELATVTPRPFLVVAGEGPMRQPLSREFDVLGLGGDASLVGYVSPVDDLVLAADVVVLLSRAEGLPQVLLQAAVVGTPFVSYEVDGPAELLARGAVGSVLAAGDASGAARAVGELIRRGERGEPIDVSPWSPEEIASGYVELVGAVDRTGAAVGGPAR